MEEGHTDALEPCDSIKANGPTVSNDQNAGEVSVNPTEAGLSPLVSRAILDDKMSTLNHNSKSIAREGEHAALRNRYVTHA